MKTALDSNILSCLWSAEKPAPHVKQQLVSARADGNIVICAAVYVELAAHPLITPGRLDQLLEEADVEIEFLMGESVWRKAAEVFAAYAERRRRSGGSSPKRLLADFVIAAHALLQADRLFTLDPARYERDFPSLKLF